MINHHLQKLYKVLEEIYNGKMTGSRKIYGSKEHSDAYT